ncbi:HAD-like domain-containing protein [Melanogaster broomeanus]|nr:HAD-like domain-containing protein [Melanogaster broomeanus]
MTSDNAASNTLRDVDAYMFDSFGTTVDWFTTVTREVPRRSRGALAEGLLRSFAREWRQGYYAHVRAVNEGGDGSLNIDVAHRKILDEMLTTPRWSHLATVWDDRAREDLVKIWHDLDTYADSVPGLTALKQHGVVITLSNGSYRLLLDMAKNKRLPWDGIISTEFFGVYKPPPRLDRTKQAYLSAAYHIDVPPERVAMVAAHKWDLQGAAQAGLKTIYDTKEIRENMRSKAEGGEVDLVVKDFQELARLAAEVKKDAQ